MKRKRQIRATSESDWLRPPALRLTPDPAPKKNVGEDTLLWQIKAYALPMCIPQFPFAKSLGRRFTADFGFPTQRVLVEVKGGIWRPGGGAHSHPVDLTRDIEREKYMALLRYVMLPVTPQEVINGKAIEWIQRVLHAHGWTPCQ